MIEIRIHRWQELRRVVERGLSLSLGGQPGGGCVARPVPHAGPGRRVLVGVEPIVVAVVLAHYLLKDVVRLLQGLFCQEPARYGG